MDSMRALVFKEWPWLHWNALRPDAVALFNEERPITWHQLCEDIASFSFSCEDSASPYLAILSQNNYASLLCMLSAWQRGQCTLMLNPFFSIQDRNDILANAGIHTLIEPSFSFQDAKTKQNTPFDLMAPLTLTLTSGSTGRPKVVVHTAKNHLASAEGLLSLLPFEKTQIWLLSLPLFHVSGLAIVWRWLLKGAILKIAPIQGNALQEALKGVTHASLVPTQLQRLLKKRKPRALQSVLLGGGAISQTLVDAAERLGIQCWCGYGMTEMASTITAKRANGKDSVGAPLPFRQLTLSPFGEIAVKGETLFVGYLSAGEIEPVSSDWFYTKDKGAWLNKNRDLNIVGRMDNMFICGGEKIQPETIEQKLCVYPGVLQLFILPFPDEIWGEVPVAVIQGKVDSAAFLSWAKEKLPAYQCPKWAVLFPEQGVETGIKISRRDLLAWLRIQKISPSLSEKKKNPAFV